MNLECQFIEPASEGLPVSSSVWIARTPVFDRIVSNPLNIFSASTLAFFCSSKCPGSVILRTLDGITTLRDEGQVIVGGFHSVIEWKCLGILLRGRQPVIWVPARSIVGMRLKPDLQPAFKDGRLLILSPFSPVPSHSRATAALAGQRNRFVASLADRIFVPHAAPGSRTLALCKELYQGGKKILTIADPLNSHMESLDPEYLDQRSPPAQRGDS